MCECGKDKCALDADALHQLPSLPYGPSELEPFYSGVAMEMHYEVYHRLWLGELNAIVSRLRSEKAYLRPDQKRTLRGMVAMYGSGHAMHNLFWESMAAQPQPPQGQMADMLRSSFGSHQEAAREMVASANAAMERGWLMLGYCANTRRLKVAALPGQPLTSDLPWVPLVVCDLWEHAYEFQYGGDRQAWVEAFCHIIDWQRAGAILCWATQQTAAQPSTTATP
jgi:Fe-Mn family superoxide dismutase